MWHNLTGRTSPHEVWQTCLLFPLPKPCSPILSLPLNVSHWLRCPTFHEHLQILVLTKLWSEKEPTNSNSDVTTEWCVTLPRDICIQKELRETKKLAFSSIILSKKGGVYFKAHGFSSSFQINHFKILPLCWWKILNKNFFKIFLSLKGNSPVDI